MFSLTNSYWGSAGVTWTSSPAGLTNVVVSPDGSTFTFSPSNSLPTNYTIRAEITGFTNCYDTTTVTVCKVEIDTPPPTNMIVCDSANLHAMGQPSGGTYQWTNTSGRARFTNTVAGATQFSPGWCGSITVQVTYAYSTVLCTDMVSTVATFPQLSAMAGWNVPGIQASNNCYNYATDIRTDTFAQPGRASGYTPANISTGEYTTAAVSDGLQSGVNLDNLWDTSGLPNGHVVALVIDPGNDFHWYRMEADGTWTHKPGSTPATSLDNSGNPITDPRTADRDGYTDFGGFFWVGPSVNIN